MNNVTKINTTTRTYPRTLRQADSDPMDWWVKAEAEAAQEEHIRAMFRGPEPRSWVWGNRCIAAILVGIVVALLFGGVK